MELKWFFIFAAVMYAAMFGGMAIDGWGKSNCRMDMGRAGRSVADIEQICK